MSDVTKATLGRATYAQLCRALRRADRVVTASVLVLAVLLLGAIWLPWHGQLLLTAVLILPVLATCGWLSGTIRREIEARGREHR